MLGIEARRCRFIWGWGHAYSSSDGSELVAFYRDGGKENGNYHGILGFYTENGNEHGNY